MINGKVYDIQDWKGQAPCGAENLQQFSTLDATQQFQMVNHSQHALNMMNSYLIGSLIIPELESSSGFDVSTFSSPFMDLERNIATFLGLHCNRLVSSILEQPEEKLSSTFLKQDFLKGGIHAIFTPNPFDDEKGETHSLSSAAVTPLSGVTPTEPRPTENQISGYDSELSPEFLIKCLMESSTNNQYLRIYLSLLDRLSRKSVMPMHMDFPSDHPVEEVGRHLLAVLLKHQEYYSKKISVIKLYRRRIILISKSA